MVQAAKNEDGWGIFRSIDKAKRSEPAHAKASCDIGDLERQIDAVRTESIKCTSERTELENENHILQGKLASTNVNLVELERKLERARGQIADLQKEHAQLVRQLSSKDVVIKDLNSTAQQAEKALRISHAATNSLLLEFLSTLSEVQVLPTKTFGLLTLMLPYGYSRNGDHLRMTIRMRGSRR